MILVKKSFVLKDFREEGIVPESTWTNFSYQYSNSTTIYQNSNYTYRFINRKPQQLRHRFNGITKNLISHQDLNGFKMILPSSTTTGAMKNSLPLNGKCIKLLCSSLEAKSFLHLKSMLTRKKKINCNIGIVLWVWQYSIEFCFKAVCQTYLHENVPILWHGSHHLWGVFVSWPWYLIDCIVWS